MAWIGLLVSGREIGGEPPNQNASIETFNAHLRDECLNEHGFPTRLHARSEIETLRREYNEERPKTILGGLTPAAHP